MNSRYSNSPATAASCELLHELIAVQAATIPTATALWWQGAATDYASLHRHIMALAKRLCSDGEPGDRIAVLSWNSPEFVELLYGVPAAGRILVPLNARLAPAELIYQLNKSGASTLFADPALLEPLQQHPGWSAEIRLLPLAQEYLHWRDTGPTGATPAMRSQDPAWILFTSGSTGRPKGAVLTHRSFIAGLDSAALGRPVESSDKYYYPFPLFHVAAHNVLLQHRHGAAVVLARSFDASDTLRACRELQVTTLSLAPTMIAMLLQHPEFSATDLNSVRTIGYGASAMPQTLLQRLLTETQVGLCQSYGMTELSGSVAFLTVQDHQRAARNQPELLQSVGRPLSTAKIKLLDDNGDDCDEGQAGEILVAGQPMHARLLAGRGSKRPGTGVDGWLHTGDVGRFDAQGYLYIVDRKKDMIISGGENIASREVEEALRQHRAVRDCAVIALPDPRWGESACAVVQLSEEVDNRELEAHCRQLLAGYKTPRQWFRSDHLPLNAAGKIDKPLLRKRYARRN